MSKSKYWKNGKNKRNISKMEKKNWVLDNVIKKLYAKFRKVVSIGNTQKSSGTIHDVKMGSMQKSRKLRPRCQASDEDLIGLKILSEERLIIIMNTIT